MYNYITWVHMSGHSADRLSQLHDAWTQELISKAEGGWHFRNGWRSVLSLPHSFLMGHFTQWLGSKAEWYSGGEIVTSDFLQLLQSWLGGFRFLHISRVTQTRKEETQTSFIMEGVSKDLWKCLNCYIS